MRVSLFERVETGTREQKTEKVFSLSSQYPRGQTSKKALDPTDTVVPEAIDAQDSGRPK